MGKQNYWVRFQCVDEGPVSRRSEQYKKLAKKFDNKHEAEQHATSMLDSFDKLCDGKGYSKSIIVEILDVHEALDIGLLK